MGDTSIWEKAVTTEDKIMLTLNGHTFEADKEMVDFLRACNAVGLMTTQHCAGHPHEDPQYDHLAMVSFELASLQDVLIRNIDGVPRVTLYWKRST